VLPPSYEIPAAILLVVGGVLSCFAGYRMFRVVLGIYGFVLGAMLASSIMGVSNTVGMIVAAVVGGAIGALILTLAYFAGIALVGAGLGVLLVHAVWTLAASASSGPGAPADPPMLVVVGFAAAGAVAASILQRYVIIAATAFGGAWTLIVGLMALGDRGAAKAASAGNVWILYPLDPAPGRRWIVLVWLVLGLLGAGVQLKVKGRKR
jgi:hypothetical protein